MSCVHKCLLRYQTTKELERKAIKAMRTRNKIWTQEELDLAIREASMLGKALGWDYDEDDLYIEEK